MSFNFEDSNIYLVPRRHVLKFYDIYQWQLISMDVHRMRVVLDGSVEGELRVDVENHLTADGGWRDKAYAKRYKDKLRSFFRGAQYEKMDGAEENREDHSFPISFWVYLTDHPAESFKKKHYSSGPPQLSGDLTWITVGAKFLDSLERGEDAEWDGKTYPGKIRIGMEGISSRRMEEGELLPIWGEYCGYFGKSKRGNVINYTYVGGVADESMCATPLYRNGHDTYHTLYFVSPPRYIDYPINPNPRELEKVSLNLYGEERKNVLHLLEEDGFRITDGFKNKAYVLSREGDVVHYYPAPKACEPFLIAACHHGSFDPRERGRLISSLSEKCFNFGNFKSKVADNL